MFERLTDSARRVIVLAQEEARLLRHQSLGSEHLLLGLLHEEHGVAAKVLEGIGVSLDAARVQVELIVGKGERVPSGHLPFTPNAKAALEMSSRAAEEFSSGWIDTEHLLLALIGREGSTAVLVLEALNADLETARLLLIARAID